jgi:DNA-binding MarR family transcriptional regulator
MSSPLPQESETREAQLRTLVQETRQVLAESGLLFDRLAQARGLNVTDVQCQNILDYTGPIPAGKLAELAHLTTGAITNVVDRLEKRGYVRREKDPHDRRRVIIVPLEHGGTEFFGFIQERFEEILASYSAQELATILRFLRQLHPLSAEAMRRLPEAHTPTEPGSV